MRLALLCGCLEPGRDGVGDYVRQLAMVCRQEGIEIAMVALADPWVAEVEEGEQEGLRILRLPMAVARPMRERVGSWLADWKPDWISLQFVPYAFQAKGIPWGLPAWLAGMGCGGRWHVMFHELWIGESTGYGLKDRAVGLLQKWTVRRLLGELRPLIVHTSNPVYVELLRRNGTEAHELPLFGNVPLAAGDREWFTQAIRITGVAFEESSRNAFWLAGIFGSIHPQWSVRPWLDELCASARRSGKRLVLLQIGHTPEAGKVIWEQIRADYAGRAEVITLGIQSTARLSTIFQMLDLGIATSPWALLGKSGSVAAMLDHGLPVLVTRDDWKLRRGSTPEPTPHPLLFRFGAAFLKRIAEPPPDSTKEPRIASVATQFLEALRAGDRAMRWQASAPLAK